jgi:uncharacterized protein (TIGR03083 family)
MGPAEIYASCRTTLVDLAAALTPEQMEARLAATPPWTVVDGYRHLTGVCADVLDGTARGGPTPEWTAAQIAARAERSLSEVVAEWVGRAPDLEAQIDAGGMAMGFCVLDVWVHGVDISAAVGRPGDRNDPRLPGLIDLALGAFGPFYTGKGGPALRLVIDGEERSLGEGDAEISLTTSAYELMRMIFGRRSEAQIAAADWSGDSDAARANLHLFDTPPTDLTD